MQRGKFSLGTFYALAIKALEGGLRGGGEGEVDCRVHIHAESSIVSCQNNPESLSQTNMPT